MHTSPDHTSKNEKEKRFTKVKITALLMDGYSKAFLRQKKIAACSFVTAIKS